MKTYASTRTLAKNPQVAHLLSTSDIRTLRSKTQLTNLDRVIGWGFKPSADKARSWASEMGCPYIALEDGFISWIDHPSIAEHSERLSYILDEHGVYYNSSSPSGLDALLENTQSVDYSRINSIVEHIQKWGISKYNHPRLDINEIKNVDAQRIIENGNFYLVVDQTLGDASIDFSGACLEDFHRMLQTALQHAKENQQSLVIKAHPDVLKDVKLGCIQKSWIEDLDSDITVVFLTEDVKLNQLFARTKRLYTVCSQLGFEALMYDVPVYTFAWPFYSGRGLTADFAAAPLPMERKKVCKEQLFQCALIEYPVYLHPYTHEQCEIEPILDLIQANIQARNVLANTAWIEPVSIWKQSFLGCFISPSVEKHYFSRPPKSMSANDAVVSWGMNDVEPGIEGKQWRIEDGFIRSVGLGADFRRPSSLVVDDLGIYYNGKQTSRLESLLNSYSLNEYESMRALRLIDRLTDEKVSKYNVGQNAEISGWRKEAGSKKIILVVAQYQYDSAMVFGTESIKSNRELLQRVRSDYPNAFIVYKEHPDVYSGVRKGGMTTSDVLALADVYLSDIAIQSVFPHVDHVCTIGSLAGFEALIQGLTVSTYGLPFYAGWGLTTDICSFPRRSRVLNLSQLVYISLVLYPRYVDWRSRKITTVETVLDKMSNGQSRNKLANNWLHRQFRKSKNLLQSLTRSRM